MLGLFDLTDLLTWLVTFDKNSSFFCIILRLATTTFFFMSCQRPVMLALGCRQRPVDSDLDVPQDLETLLSDGRQSLLFD